MGEYLLKSAACMAVFLLFYQFLLEKERMHHFKRFFLLGALLASLIIPAMVFTEYVEATAPAHVPQTTRYVSQEMLPSSEPVTDRDLINWALLFWTIYYLGLVLFGFRFVKHLHQIVLRIRNNPKLKLNAITQV
ncbi:MAG: peptidase M56, partial [Bacteroidota bacterium]